mgnify:CR=1 FL=1
MVVEPICNKHEEPIRRALIDDPFGRRHIINGWNVEQLDEIHLPPCHSFFQFYVLNGKLSCLWYQRSCDAFVSGFPRIPDHPDAP